MCVLRSDATTSSGLNVTSIELNYYANDGDIRYKDVHLITQERMEIQAMNSKIYYSMGLTLSNSLLSIFFLVFPTGINHCSFCFDWWLQNEAKEK